MSPSTLLKRRRGNSFEMATLLCSMLIGAGYPAVVVSGVAVADTVENNQRSFPCPFEIFDMNTEESKEDKMKTYQKYKLRPMPDLSSHLNENIQELLGEKADSDQTIQEEIKNYEEKVAESKPSDQYHYRRWHAWVAIIENAPWSTKPKKTYVNEYGDVAEEPYSVTYIEPSTGLFYECNCRNYILVDSVWNNLQYYVNKQNYSSIKSLSWDLRSPEDWEHLLPGEPSKMITLTANSEENIISSENIISEEKHIDAIRSWVSRLHIGIKKFEERFPQLQKTVLYKGAQQERFSPYTQMDGKVMQLTLYDEDCKQPTLRWIHYQNRADLLLEIKFNYQTFTVEETFEKGRHDSLKFLRSHINNHALKELYFYPESRLDCLEYLKMNGDCLELHYSKRKDFCFYKKFELKPAGQVLTKITEKFNRNLLLSADNDIAVREFLIKQNKILLKYQYVKGVLTASTLEFTKPRKLNYGEEVSLDPNLIKTYKGNTSPPDLDLELYRTLLTQLQHEEELKKQFQKMLEEVHEIIDSRTREMQSPRLKFRIFDCLRNTAARTKRLEQYSNEKDYQRKLKATPTDFLAPYLVPYKNRTLSYEESWAAYNACLFDIKSRFVYLLNDLQSQYEDTDDNFLDCEKFLLKVQKRGTD